MLALSQARLYVPKNFDMDSGTISSPGPHPANKAKLTTVVVVSAIDFFKNFCLLLHFPF